LRPLLLFFVEQAGNLARQLGLRPENVPGVMDFLIGRAGGMPIEDGPAKSDAALGVAVGTEGDVPARDDKLKFTGAPAAENGDTLILSPFVTERVVLELPQKTVIPGRVDDPFEDVVNQPLLFPGKEIAADDGPGDLPVVGDESPQQAPLFIVIIPVEAN